MTSPYEMFSTNKDHEKKGVVLDYGDFEIRVARAGGANVKYTKMLDIITKPYRRAIANETLPPEIVKKIYREVYAKSIVLDWKGVKDADGKKLDFTIENCIKLFEDLDDLFLDIQEQVNKSALFKSEGVEEDLKN